ncbi:MAG: hypothetical protein FWG91_06995 [Lachnospiraceae bacterium]|nr:hypothetical protein [Lachnospiraceae bacterium]
MIDFLFVYEIKNREIETIILLGEELKRRGYKVEYIHVLMQRKLSRKEEINTILKFNLKSGMNTIIEYSQLVKSFKHFVNLRFEQVFSNHAHKFADSLYPHDCVKGLFHLCWGRAQYNELVERKITPDSLIMAGPIHMDFLRPAFSIFYKSKKELQEEYCLLENKSIFLFIESGFLSRREAEGVVSRYPESRLVETHDDSLETFSIILLWIEKYLQSFPDTYFIYRPHPGKVDDMDISELKKYENFREIKDYSIKQWILVSDIVATTTSTSIIEAYFAGKKCVVLRPKEIENRDDSPIYHNCESIKTLEDFLKINTETGQSLDERVVKEFYDVDEKYPSFMRMCDALEKIYADKRHIIDLDNLKIGKNRLTVKNWGVKWYIKNKMIALQSITNISFGEKTDYMLKTLKTRKSYITSNDEIALISNKIRKILH